MPGALTFEDIILNDGVSSSIINFLSWKDKKSLRLVCHGCCKAVDKTVTSVQCVQNDAKMVGILLQSNNWKDLRKIHLYSALGRGPRIHLKVINQLAGKFSKLEDLGLYFDDSKNVSSVKLVKAGLQLRKLTLSGPTIPPKWFGALVSKANWQLESLKLDACNGEIAALIATSKWPLKLLHLDSGAGSPTISPEAVEALMQGSWVSTIEELRLNHIKIGAKGARAIAEASHKAVNLHYLALTLCDITNKEALILGEQGNYPNIKRLNMDWSELKLSGIVSILRKCPVLEKFPVASVLQGAALDDAEDAKVLAEQLRRSLTLDLSLIEMSCTAPAVHELFSHCDWPMMERLCIADVPSLRDFADEIISCLVQHEWPSLKKLVLVNVGITSHGYRLFSACKFPALEVLRIEAYSGLELATENLPKLANLALTGVDPEPMRHILTQCWPNLRMLEWWADCEDDEDDEDDSLEYSSERAKVMQGITAQNMPNLIRVELCFEHFHDSDRCIIEEVAYAGFESLFDVVWT